MSPPNRMKVALPPASVMDRFSSAEGLAAARAEAAAQAAAQDSEASPAIPDDARTRRDADDSDSHRDDASSVLDSPGHPQRHMGIGNLLFAVSNFAYHMCFQLAIARCVAATSPIISTLGLY